MKSLEIPLVITPTLTLPRQRGREIPGFPDVTYPNIHLPRKKSWVKYGREWEGDGRKKIIEFMAEMG